MKKLIIPLIMIMILLTGFNYNNTKSQKYATLGSYIYNLVNTSEIQIKFFKAPKASEYFGDVGNSDYYAGAFINAAVSGILKFPQKRIYPKKWINVSEAKQLMDRAYTFKTKQKISISKIVFSELSQTGKYKKIKDNYYLTSQMEKDIFAIYSKKIAEYKKTIEKQKNSNDKINVSKKVENDYLLITLDWGSKPAAGYELKIAGARETGDTIEVFYTTSTPSQLKITNRVISSTKDTIRLKPGSINKAYNIVTEKIDGYEVNDTKYSIQTNGSGIKLTLSLGEKPTGGYSINILEAKQIGEKIMVKYDSKIPVEGDMITQGITYPSDSVDVKVTNVNKKYGILLERVGKNTSSTFSNNGIKVSTAREGEYIVVTLDWGQKPTGGYIIKILEAKQVGDTIEVKYMTRSPGPSDIVTQALTYPKDSIRVKVDDPSRDYKVVLIN